MRINMRRTLLTIFALVAICIAVSRVSSHDQPPRPPYVHTVIVYLKKDTPAEKVATLVADCHNILGKIPTVRGLWAGRPAEKNSPQFAVTDFQLGLTMLFDDYEGLKTYVDHPAHLKFVETYMPIVEKIQVYDFANQSK